MIENLDKINHPELKDNLLQIRLDVINLVISHGGLIDIVKLKSNINSLMYNYVLGIGKPISISDSYCHVGIGQHDYTSAPGSLNGGKVSLHIEMVVDYRITYGYEPYQSLDNPINLSFHIRESDLRDMKIDNILS